MKMFKKGLNLKIISVAISVSLLFTAAPYAYPIAENTLRVPVGNYLRIANALQSRQGQEKAIDSAWRAWLPLIQEGLQSGNGIGGIIDILPDGLEYIIDNKSVLKIIGEGWMIKIHDRRQTMDVLEEHRLYDRTYINDKNITFSVTIYDGDFNYLKTVYAGKFLQKVNPKTNPRVKAVLFDFDGTLVDPMPQIEIAFGRVYHWIMRATTEEPSEAELKEGTEYYRSMPWKTISEHLSILLKKSLEEGNNKTALENVILRLCDRYKIVPKDKSDIVENFVNIDESAIVEEFNDKPPLLILGVKSFLKKLSREGIKLYIGSGSPQKVIEGLVERFGIKDLFAGIYGQGPDFSHSFPNGKADMLRKIKEELKIESDDELIIFGDSTGDMAASKFNKNKFTGVAIAETTEKHKKLIEQRMADYVISDLQNWKLFWDEFFTSTTNKLPYESKEPVYILSVTKRYSHDATAVLLKDGKILGAIEEEREIRDKHAQVEFPKFAIRRLLKDFGITLSEIKHIVVSWDLNYYKEAPSSASPRVIDYKAMGIEYREGGLSRQSPHDPAKFEEALLQFAEEEKAQKIPSIYFAPHHRTHAYAGYFTSGFQESTLVVSIDAKGEMESTTVWLGEEGALKKISAAYYPNSIGALYSRALPYAGFKEYEDGKFMGLSPYGKPANPQEEELYDRIMSLFKEYVYINLETGEFIVNHDMLTKEFPWEFSKAFEEKLGRLISMKDKYKKILDPYSSSDRPRVIFAYCVQKITEEAVMNVANFYLKKNASTKKAKKVVIVGGVGLNILANASIVSSGLVSPNDIYISPAPADNGGPIGAALMVARDIYHEDIQKKCQLLI